jgi:integrase/recombinase XerD
MTLKEAIDIWLSQFIATTRESYARPITYMMNLVGGDLKLEDITPSDMVRYSRYIMERDDYAIKTKEKHIKTTKTFFNWCVKMEFLDKAPSRVLKTPKVDRHISRDKAMSDDDLNMLLKYTQNNPMVNAILYLVAESGMRRGAVVKMRYHKDRLFLNATQPYAITTEKGGKEVSVRIGAGAKLALQRWLVRRSPTTHDYIFITATKKPLTADYLDQMIRRIALKIEKDTGYTFERWNLHSLRHRLAHKELDEGTPVSLVATLLNHESELTTIGSYAQKDHETAWNKAGRHDMPTPDEIESPQRKEAKIIDITTLFNRNA